MMKSLKSFPFLCVLLLPFSVDAISRSFPVVQLRPLYGHFSPNGDGIQDILPVEVRLKEGRNIEIIDWQLRIYGPNGLVKTYVPDRRVLRKGLFGGTRLTLPEFFYWNGRDEKGQIQPDGRYRLELRLIHDYNRIERYSTKNVWIKTTLPDVTLSPVRLYLLLPPGENPRPVGEILIDQRVRNADDGVHYTGRILNLQGEVIEKRFWKDSLPPRISWNGRIGEDPAPPGVYRYELEWSDAAGNVKTATVNQLLVLSAARPPASMLFTDAFFVNQSSMTAPATPLRVGFSGATRPAELLLRRQKPSAFGSAEWIDVRSLKATAGASLIPLPLFGDDPAPGLYELRPAQGSSVAPVYLMLDAERPVLSIRLPARRYRPGRRFRIRPTYSDASPLFHYSLRLLLKTGEEWAPLREWKGLRLPDYIDWFGDTDNGYELRGGDELRFEFQAMDAAGHVTVVRSVPIRADLRFDPEEPSSENLIARASLADFTEPDSEEAGTLVDQIYEAWSGLDGYSVRIRVFVSFQGDEEENLLRSEKLARRIRNAVVERGIPDHVVTFRGDGETDLIAEGDDAFSEYRNNRVQIEFRRQSR